MPNKNSTDPAWTNSVGSCHGRNGPGSSLYRICGTGGAYGRLLTTNASVLRYEHVENPTGKVSDNKGSINNVTFSRTSPAYAHQNGGHTGRRATRCLVPKILCQDILPSPELSLSLSLSCQKECFNFLEK